MANNLRMDLVHTIVSLHKLSWSDRRIARELGIHRETVGRHLRLARAGPEPATNLPAGSGPCSKPASAPLGSELAKPASGAPTGSAEVTLMSATWIQPSDENDKVRLPLP